MNIFVTTKTSWRALMANRVRTALTVLGMVIGISSVVIVYSAGEGLRGLIVGQIESFGTDIIETEVKVPSTKKGVSGDSSSATAISQGVQITTLKLDDMEKISKLPNVRDGYAGLMGQEKISYGNESRKAFLLGTNASYIEIDKSEVDYGRFFTEAEDKSLGQLVVLGSGIKEKLFGDSDPIGKFVKVRKNKYEVIGVLKERGAVMAMNFDDYIYIPIRTVQKRILGIDHVNYMVHRLIDLKQADDTAEAARFTLRESHEITNPDKDDFRVVTMEEMMKTLGTVTGAITLLLLAIVAISLLVGGVGIMNVMYVVVSERTSEIGLRKAVGARNYEIMGQFLVESILITLLGAFVGIVLGWTASYLLYLGAKSYGFDWRFMVPTQAYITSVGFSLFFGIIFGLYPARKASKLNPIEALRKE